MWMVVSTCGDFDTQKRTAEIVAFWGTSAIRFSIQKRIIL